MLYIPFLCYSESRQSGRPPYGADIALLSYPHMVILLLHMAGGGGRGGPPDLKRENVRHVRNFISATPLSVNLLTTVKCWE